LRTLAGQDGKPRKVLCADAHGFSLHAAVRCGADQHKQLERLCRYITRPALANERPVWVGCRPTSMTKADRRRSMGTKVC